MLSFLFRLTARLPLLLIHKLGAVLGWAVWRLSARTRTMTMRQLNNALPDLNPQSPLVRAQALEMGKAALEIPMMWQAPRERLEPLILDAQGAEVLHAAQARGKGVIVMTPHIGCWELAGHWLQWHYPITVLYRPATSPAWEALLRQGRTRFGTQLAPTDVRGVRQLYSALRRGELVMMLPDQVPTPPSGVIGTWFGQQARSMTLWHRLAQQSGAALVLCACERLAPGQGFRMHLWSVPEAAHNPDAEQASEAFNRELESMALRWPAQYVWSYNRYKHSTPPETS